MFIISGSHGIRKHLDLRRCTVSPMSESSENSDSPADDEIHEAVQISAEDFQHMMMALDAAGDDVRQIVTALGLGDHARDISPHDVVQLEVLPAILKLVSTQALVDSSVKDLEARAKLLGNKTLKMPDGTEAVLVGRKLPKDFLK